MQQFGPGFAATFLYYFSSTAVVFTLVTAQSLGTGVSGLPQQVGLMGGLVGGLLGAYFNRTVTFTVPAKSEKAFLKQMESTLSSLGYQLKAQDDDVRIYERSGASKFFSGKVYVQISEGNAAIASRAVQIRQLKKLLGS